MQKWSPVVARGIRLVLIIFDFIPDERGRELLGEMKRWFDLTRTGKLIERVNKYKPHAAAIQDYHVSPSNSAGSNRPHLERIWSKSGILICAF